MSQARPSPGTLPARGPLTPGLTLGSSSASCCRTCCCPATRRSCRCFWASSSCGGRGVSQGSLREGLGAHGSEVTL